MTLSGPSLQPGRKLLSPVQDLRISYAAARYVDICHVEGQNPMGPLRSRHGQVKFCTYVNVFLSSL